MRKVDKEIAAELSTDGWRRETLVNRNVAAFVECGDENFNFLECGGDSAASIVLR
ncbi:MAG: hypothetical protein ACSHYB_11280 [Roseibacillus sp.]